MIIGLTGKNAAGKGEIAAYLKEKEFVYHSLSDALRDVAKEKNMEASRENLIKLGTELREQHGNGILAQKTNEKIAQEKENGYENFVIDSIRNPGEIEELRKNSDFKLIGVHTNADIRFKRLLKRGRTGDATTLEEFEKFEQLENKKSGGGQQLDKCLEMVDEMINSNGTIEQANADVEAYLQTL